jgi:hypothetical protein
MARRISTEVASIGIRLGDEAYMSWCTVQMQCQDALRAWFDARPHDRAEAICVYRAAWIASRRPPATSSRCRSWRMPPDRLVVRPDTVRPTDLLPERARIAAERSRIARTHE